MLSLGEHYGQGLCECSHDKYGLLEWDPGCPVEGHTEAVTQVQFSDDGAQVVQRFWGFNVHSECPLTEHCS